MGTSWLVISFDRGTGMGNSFIKAGLLIDGKGGAPEPHRGILFGGGKIIDILPMDKVPEDCTVHDYSAGTVMPGMINAHIHLDMPPVADPFPWFRDRTDAEKILACLARLEKYLASGVTYVRSLGCENYIDVKFRNAIRAGMVKGPGIVCAGPNLCMTGGHGWGIGIQCDGVDECRKAARTVIRNDVDCVKLMATGGVMTPNVEPGSQQFTYDEMRVIIEEAHKAGKKTASHAQGEHGIKDAVAAGIDSIEHGIFLTDEIIEMMLKNGTFLVPTLVAPYYISKNGLAGGIPEFAVRKSDKIGPSHLESFKKAYTAGVRIALGTDAGTPFNLHEKTWFELNQMIELGVKPMDAIIAATSNAAELLGISESYGTIEKGKMADIIVLDSNPLESIGALADVKAVFKHGELYVNGRSLLCC